MNKHLRATLRDIWDGVRAQPGRVGLSFMAICVGITALTVLVAVLGGLEERSRLMVQEFGVNVFAVVQGKTGERSDRSMVLKKQHAEKQRSAAQQKLPARSVCRNESAAHQPQLPRAAVCRLQGHSHNREVARQVQG